MCVRAATACVSVRNKRHKWEKQRACVADRWSLSGVVPHLSLSDSLLGPTSSPLSPLQSLTSSFFFPSLPHLFRPRLHPLSPDLDLHSPCRPLSFLCLSLSSPPQLHLCLFFADDINLKISRDFFLSVILDPVDTAQRTLKRFGDLSGGQKGGNSKEKTDRYDQQTNLSQNCLENIDFSFSFCSDIVFL